MGEVTVKMPRGFLRRKCVAPPLASPYVREERMSALIMDDSAWRVCLINASAGYGKTALMSQWFHDFESRENCVPLWMTLDDRDASPTRFVQGLAYLLASVDPRFGELLSDEFFDEDVELVLVDLVNLADDLCDPAKRYVLFLDGYDCASSAAFDSALLFLNRFSPDGFRFVVSGSYFSPQIDDLLLDSSVVEYRTKDLAFDDDRLRAFAFALMPDLTEGEYRDLCESSGMWPTSFVFSHLARKRSSGGDFRTTMKGYHRRFFNKEVMGRIDAKTYEFLVETAFLEWLDPDLCDCVTGGKNSLEMLGFLASRNLFVHYETESETYVHQPTFRRYLVDKTLALRTSYVSKLAQRASRWFADRGMRNEYAKYAAATCDINYVQGCIRSSTGMCFRGGYTSFLDYLFFQPASRFESDPYLAWVAVWTFVSIGLPDEARRWISVARTLSGSGGGGLAHDYADAICLALEGDDRESLDVIRRILAEGGESLPHDFQCLLIHMEGEDCERLGNPKEGRDLYLKALALAERADGAFYKLFDMYCLAHQYICIGEMGEALSIAERALTSCVEGSPTYGELHAIIAFVLIEQGNLDAADRHLKAAEGSVSSNANVDMYVDTMTTKARYEIARKNAIEAFEILSDTVADIGGSRVPRNFDMQAYALLARLSVELGETAAVNRCDRVLDSFIESRDLLRAVPCMLAKVRILWSRGDAEGSMGMLRRCRQAVQACGSAIYLVDLCIIEAGLSSELGNETQAMVSISKAVELAMRGGYLTMFLSGGSIARELVLRLATSRKTSLPIRNYAKKILMLYGTESEVDADISLHEGDVQGYYALTERERDVLHALNVGMSRRELAESFGVSQNTIKTHLKNIYAKLGVHTRAEAYRESQRLDNS